MSGVVAFEDGFTSVVQRAISQQKAEAAQRQVILVNGANAVADQCDTSLVAHPVPMRAAQVTANLERLVYFGIGEGFVPAVVPAETREKACIGGDVLQKVQPESVFNCPRCARCRYVGRGCQSCEEQLDGAPVVTHICMIDEGKHTNDAA